MDIYDELLMIKNMPVQLWEMGENVIYFNSEKRIVVSIASIFIQNAKDRIEFIKKHIEPIFENCVQ